MQFQLCSINMT